MSLTVAIKKRLPVYLRLIRWHQPVGTLLTLLPAWWGIILASPGWPSVKLLVLFTLGAFLMRSAGCIINDLWDKDIDREVERTRTRPIASGEVSRTEALRLILVLLFSALMIALHLPFTVFALSLLAVPMIVAYPLMKRYTWWPQAFLGLTFNLGVLMGWAAVTGDLATPAFCLYAAAFFWTLGYDTIYAHQDQADDARIGVKSTARLFGSDSPRWVAAFYAAMLLLLALAAYLTDLSWPFWLLWLTATGHAVWQIAWLDPSRTARCLTLFKSNVKLGFLIAIALLAGRLV